MGLGESASAGASLYALMVIGGGLLLGLVVYGLVLAVTGRQGPALLSLLAWTALVLAVPVSAYFSQDARDSRAERQRVLELWDSVTAAAGVTAEPYNPPSLRGYCDGAIEQRWEHLGAGDAGEPDVLDRFQKSLAEQGFRTTRAANRPGGNPRGRIVQRVVLGTRDTASVLVGQYVHDERTGKFDLAVEDGCGQFEQRD